MSVNVFVKRKFLFSLPDTPLEPDPEPIQRGEMKIIPTEDITGSNNVHDYKNVPWPEAITHFAQPPQWGMGPNGQLPGPPLGPPGPPPGHMPGVNILFTISHYISNLMFAFSIYQTRSFDTKKI